MKLSGMLSESRVKGAEMWSEWQDLNLRPPRPERGAPRVASENVLVQCDSVRRWLPPLRFEVCPSVPRRIRSVRTFGQRPAYPSSTLWVSVAMGLRWPQFDR